MQHVDVQHMALDPFATVEQTAQFAQLALDLEAEDLLHRVDRTHLVGDRADAADARGDVRRFAVAAPAQESLEETRRFEDP